MLNDVYRNDVSSESVSGVGTFENGADLRVAHAGLLASGAH